MPPLPTPASSLLPAYAVITVCLNSARTIGRTIDSVLRQDPLPAEYVFVDGGSTDGTPAIIQAAVARGRREGLPTQFTLLEQREPRGITPAWNLALAHCRAEVVFILNSDDWYEDHCARRVLTVLAATPEADVVLANTRNYRRGEPVPCGGSRNRPAWMLPLLMPFVHPACFVRRSLYTRVGPFDPCYRLLADYDFLYRCSRQGLRAVTLDEALVNFELGGSANSNRELARREMFAIGKRHCAIPFLPHLVFALRSLLGR